MHVTLFIPKTQGYWKIQRLTTGPRGGKKWELVVGQAATGGTYNTELVPGNYKEIWTVNGWSRSRQFTIPEETPGIVAPEEVGELPEEEEKEEEYGAYEW